MDMGQRRPQRVGTTAATSARLSHSLLHVTSPQGATKLSDNPVHTPDICSLDCCPNTKLNNRGDQCFYKTSSSPRQNQRTVGAKRHHQPSTDESPVPFSKANKSSDHVVFEKAAACHWEPGHRDVERTVKQLPWSHWEPGHRDVERTLKLLPWSPSQLIKRPRGDQPVVVLNHPDTDIPEVTDIMKTVHRYKEEVQKVVLSQKTLKALAVMEGEAFITNTSEDFQTTFCQSVWPKNRVKERFILKMKLKKMSRRKYKVVNAISHNAEHHLRFRCWFCGRAFSDQEIWIRHGQRHVMESTVNDKS
ncbi:hypothetical protein DPEC_G00041250 [Dallia pectoralis]|uniref:Uncharacterized protein n=1 Tax=Dallia pectoralis TaxID=75939 RepID=A0ACC2HF05_DALPE|nr:hypothetical protein DPEC_G00041250 [Dallia pectoralis]